MPQEFYSIPEQQEEKIPISDQKIIFQLLKLLIQKKLITPDEQVKLMGILQKEKC